MEQQPQEPVDADPAESTLPVLDDDLTIDDELAEDVVGGHACGRNCVTP